jgi:hypothetical protein
MEKELADMSAQSNVCRLAVCSGIRKNSDHRATFQRTEFLRIQQRLQTAVLALLAPMCVVLTACAPAAWNVSALNWGEEEQPAGPAPETCLVRFEPKDARPEQIEVPLRQQMFVSDLLEAVKAEKRYRRMDITVFRASQDDGRWHRMESEYQGRKHGVTQLTNYEIRPGDRVVIAEDTSTTLDRILEGMNPLGRLTTQ